MEMLKTDLTIGIYYQLNAKWIYKESWVPEVQVILLAVGHSLYQF